MMIYKLVNFFSCHKNILFCFSFFSFLICPTFGYEVYGPSSNFDKKDDDFLETRLAIDRKYLNTFYVDGKNNIESFPRNVLAVVAHNLVGFKNQSKLKLCLAFSFIEDVVNSEEFKNKILYFKNTRGERRFNSLQGYSNTEVYNIFMEGREVLLPETPYEINYNLRLYYNPLSKVIGYTRPNDTFIYLNKKFFNRLNIQEIAGNLVHEWTHKLGFDHESAKDHDSVPYAIGYIVRDMVGKNLLKGNVLNKSSRCY